MQFLVDNDPMTTLGTLFTTISGWMGTVANTIAGNTLMLLPIGIFCVGAAIGLIRRLLP